VNEPYPDGRRGDCPDPPPWPEARYEARESLSLAFVAALQHLPPRQRAAFILRDVLGFPAAAAAAVLDCSTDAVDSDLNRARTEFAAQLPPGARDCSPWPDSPRERAVVAGFARAFERGDTDGIAGWLTDDAWLALPSLLSRYRGAAAARFLSVTVFGAGTRRFRLVATRANGQPAFGCYLRDPAACTARGCGLIVLTLAGDQVRAVTWFTDSNLLARFALPGTLPD